MLKIKKMIIENLPADIKNCLKLVYNNFKWKGSNRIFCISMQRSGTTSVGNFFSSFGYPVATNSIAWKNKWSKYWYNGDYNSIFSSKEFNSYQVFEDDPWWLPEFYKVLYHKFPNSKFILLTRDSESWFNSMLSHSNGKTLGNTKLHCKIYRREKDFYSKMDSGSIINLTIDEIDNHLKLDGYKEHYKDIYQIRNREIINFFKENDSSRLIHCDLQDQNKWNKIGKFFGINVPDGFKMHSNKSQK